jgi:membrane protein implicated in regulation of membrane protease activity
LIKAEVGSKAQIAGQGAGLIFGAVLALTMSMLTGTALVIIALANLVAPWLAALNVMCFWLLMTVALALIGRSRFKKFASEPITSAKALKGRSR